MAVVNNRRGAIQWPPIRTASTCFLICMLHVVHSVLCCGGFRGERSGGLRGGVLVAGGVLSWNMQTRNALLDFVSIGATTVLDVFF